MQVEKESRKRLHLRPRLLAVSELAGDAAVMADVGCDHGRLGLSLLQTGAAKRIIATDINEKPLKKAIALAQYIGLTGKIEFRLGDGLAPLGVGEAGCLLIAGMGGILMAEMLEHAPVKLMGAARAVLQPMRGVAQLRSYLYNNGYRVTGERIAYDASRYYQVLRVEPGEEGPLIDGWPEGCFDAGTLSICEEEFKPMVKALIIKYNRELARARGTRAEQDLTKKLSDAKKLYEI